MSINRSFPFFNFGNDDFVLFGSFPLNHCRFFTSLITADAAQLCLCLLFDFPAVFLALRMAATSTAGTAGVLLLDMTIGPCVDIPEYSVDRMAALTFLY
jgi:hypothetical protein